MKIAVTGATGKVGKLVVAHALEQGHEVVAIDVAPPPPTATPGTERDHDHDHEYKRDDGYDDIPRPQNRYSTCTADLTDYEQTVGALAGCEGVVHLAALPTPGDGKAVTHNNNVVVSWNVLRAAAELGITRVAQASSVNVIGLFWNEDPLQIDYLPLDELHPCRPDDPYSLSKQICEAQADAVARRFPHIRIASLRIHMVVPARAHALRVTPRTARRQLWGYTLESSCAEAFVRGVTAGGEGGEEGMTHVFRSGHERFFVVEPDVACPGEEGVDVDVGALLEREWRGVPVRGEIRRGRRGLFDCGKAERLLGWRSGG